MEYSTHEAARENMFGLRANEFGVKPLLGVHGVVVEKRSGDTDLLVVCSLNGECVVLLNGSILPVPLPVPLREEITEIITRWAFEYPKSKAGHVATGVPANIGCGEQAAYLLMDAGVSVVSQWTRTDGEVSRDAEAIWAIVEAGAVGLAKEHGVDFNENGDPINWEAGEGAPISMLRLAEERLGAGDLEASARWFYRGWLRAWADCELAQQVDPEAAADAVAMLEVFADLNMQVRGRTDVDHDALTNEAVHWDRITPKAYDRRWALQFSLGQIAETRSLGEAGMEEGLGWVQWVDPNSIAASDDSVRGMFVSKGGANAIW